MLVVLLSVISLSGTVVSLVTVHPSSVTGVKQIMPKALGGPGINVLSHVVRHLRAMTIQGNWSDYAAQLVLTVSVSDYVIGLSIPK